MAQTIDWADVNVVGIPRALLYYRFGVLWTTFFEAIGRTVVVSEATDKAIADAGEHRSVDECCLASKVFVGHVESLMGRCDAVFVPSYPTADHRAGFCTKFQSAPDLIKSTFRDDGLRVISCEVREARKMREVRRAFEEMATRMGVALPVARRAFKAAWEAQEARDKARADEQARLVRTLQEGRRAAARAEAAAAGAAAGKGAKGTAEGAAGAAGKGSGAKEAASAAAPLGILVVAHPYITHDPYLSGAVTDALASMGAEVIFADAVDHDKAYKKSFEFSDTMPWLINRELIGAILMLQDAIDGIVLISAFPCGPDSMTDDAIMRCIQGKPILNLMIDAQSGTAGVETRVESFIDILRFQQKGGYVHA